MPTLQMKGNMPKKSIIIFVCEHGAAKSIIAAAYFNKLAREKGLYFEAIARGTHPEAELSSTAVAGLLKDRLIPTESMPVKLTREELESAQRVISFCTLPEEYYQKAILEGWESVPPVSEDYERARDAIVGHLKEFINHL
jgi:arsenate reductase (thioredoxin)